MSHLSTLETNYCLYLVSFSEEPFSLIYSGIEVVLLNAAGELNLLDLNDNLLLLCFLFSLVTLETELSVIDCAAYRGSRIRNYKNEIYTVVVRKGSCIVDLHNAYLLIRGADNSYLGSLDLFIDEQILVVVSANGFIPPKTKNAYRESPYAHNIPLLGRVGIYHTHLCGMVRTEILLVVEAFCLCPEHYITFFAKCQ